MPRVLLAPDKFKGTLTAAEVAVAPRRPASAARRPDVEVVTAPVADGGDGHARRRATARASRRSPSGGRADRRAAGGRPRRPCADDAAVVELAAAAGLAAARAATSRR